ncbi:MAG: BON domain-containing protein [Bacteroidota bacterium]
MTSAPVATSSPVSAYGLPATLRATIERFQERRAKTTADKSLALRLKHAMQREKVALSGLAIYVNHGAVSVYGAVPNAESREVLLSLVARQPGVTRIVDHLRLVSA